MSDYPTIHWNEDGEDKSARWRSESGTKPPAKVMIADDRITIRLKVGLFVRPFAGKIREAIERQVDEKLV